MLLSKDRVGGFLLLLFCIAYAILSQSIILLPFQSHSAFNARTLPEVLSVLGIGLSILIILFPGSAEKPRFRGMNWSTVLIFLALMSGYGLTVRPLGFIVSTSLFLICGFALLGERSWKIILLVSLPIVFGFWLMMTKGLNVFLEPLPIFLRGLF